MPDDSPPLVADLMSGDVITCTPDTDLAEVAETMWETDIGFVPVVDPGSGRIDGVLTDRDACLKARLHDRPLSAIPARDAMSTTVHHCAPDDDIDIVHAAMRRHRVRRLPVVEADQLVGVISLDDLAVCAVKRSDEAMARAVARTLAILSPEGLAG